MSAVATMGRLQAIYVLDTFVLSSNSVCFVYIISFFPRLNFLPLIISAEIALRAVCKLCSGIN